MRLNRYLAAAGVGSRRKCDELIATGRVKINGEVCANFSAQPGPRDHVKVDGKLVHIDQPLTIVLHKPPGFVCTKSDPHYEVTLDRAWDSALTPKLLDGISLDGQRAQIARLHFLTPTRLRVVLRQGINRQIRRMFDVVGFKVKRLIRIRIGNLRLGDLPRGHWRKLNPREIKSLISVIPSEVEESLTVNQEKK